MPSLTGNVLAWLYAARPGEYGVGMTFLPVERHERMLCEGVLEKIVREEGLSVLGWRDTPINATMIGRLARSTQPYIQQIFVRRSLGMDQDALERKLYVVRKRAEAAVAQSDWKEKGFFYIPSLSSRTIVYKGLLLAPQIAHFYKELSDPEVVSALCLVHQRYSTNTFPNWQFAHPFRSGATTAKSTHCAAMSTGCMPVIPCWLRHCSGRM